MLMFVLKTRQMLLTGVKLRLDRIQPNSMELKRLCHTVYYTEEKAKTSIEFWK